MEGTVARVVGSTGSVSAEAVPVLKPEVVDEVLARLGRGEPVKRLAAEYGVDRKTIRAWRARGRYHPRAPRPRQSILAPHAAWLTARAPEVDFNSAVLHRELVTHFGYRGSAQQVLRFVRPLRVAARPPRATVRFETPPGQQAQVDFGQRRVWIAEAQVTAHVFVCPLRGGPGPGGGRQCQASRPDPPAGPGVGVPSRGVAIRPMPTSRASTGSPRSRTGRTGRRVHPQAVSSFVSDSPEGSITHHDASDARRNHNRERRFGVGLRLKLLVPLRLVLFPPTTIGSMYLTPAAIPNPYPSRPARSHLERLLRPAAATLRSSEPAFPKTGSWT